MSGAQGLAEGILSALRTANSSDVRAICQQDGVYGDLCEALIKLLATTGWGRSQAEEAIVFAVLDGECTMTDALLMHRTG